MNKLSNVYCLGCKMRHPEVEINEVIEMLVRGSTRYQGKGVCENGKTWCKILKQEEIPTNYLDTTPDEVEDSISVFEKGAEIAGEKEPVVEEPVVEEPVVEELVVEELVVEEPVVEEPVVEEPVVEKPVRIPQPMMPSEIESFDIPMPPKLEDSPKDSVAKRDWEEEGVETPSIPTRPMRVRQPNSRPRKIIRPPYIPERQRAEEPPSKIPDAAEIDKARKVGEFMGRSMFNAVGEEYVKYLRANWNKTKIPTEHFEYFEAAYLAGGAKEVGENKAEESQMDARTIAGIAGIGILAAWFASQVNNSDSP